MKISENFTLEELIYSKTATSNKIDNTPSEFEIINMKYLAEKILEPIREEFGAYTPTSTYRCKKLNKIVGGAKTSMHLYGYAADISFGKIKNKELFEYIKNNLEFTELINEYPDENGCPKWVHVSIVKNRENEKKVKVIK